MFEAILTFVGVVSPVVLSFYIYYRNRKDKKLKDEIISLNQEKTASNFNIGLLSNLMKLKLYGSLEVVTKKLFKRTKAMRVIVFVAINGKVEPKKVYAIFGEKDGGHQIDEEFRGVETTTEYVNMLHDLERNGSMLIETMKMKKGMLRNIYFNEGIAHSYLKFIQRYHLTDDDDAIVFMSIATDEDIPFNELELTEIDLRVGSEYKEIIDKIAK